MPDGEVADFDAVSGRTLGDERLSSESSNERCLADIAFTD
jgi:hypothetical protein